jgi:hypothetical protein
MSDAPEPPKKKQPHWMDAFQKAKSEAEAPAPAPATATSSSTSAQQRDSERRKNPRFEIDDAQAALYKEGILSVFGVGRSNQARMALDLSEGGARFLTHERIPLGSKVKVVIQIDRYKDSIEAQAEVRWCYQSAKNPRDFYSGVRFVDLEPAQARKIALMRDWFTSPQYKAVKETKVRSAKKDDGLQFMK